MRLLCPNCAKELQVPDQYAGQMMKCPLCSGTFTVPALPTMPGAVSMPPPPAMAPAPVPHYAPPPMQAAPPPPSYAPMPQAAGQPKNLAISPGFISGLAPVCLAAMLALFFFVPWVGMFPGNVAAVSQTGWQAAFGERTPDSRWQSYATVEKFWNAYYGDSLDTVLKPDVSVALIFFLVLLIPALVLSVLASAMASGVLKIGVPAALAGFWPYRYLVIAGLALGCLALLIVTLWSDFPLENAARNQVAAAIAEARAKAPTAEKEDQQRWDMELGIKLGGFALRTTAWLSLVVILNCLAVGGALIQYRMERAGVAGLPSIQMRR